jgi:hypothetical protein
MYSGSFCSRILLSNTEEGTKMRDFQRVSSCPSGYLIFTCSQMVCIGCAAVINRSFTQPWPMPPGFAWARI